MKDAPPRQLVFQYSLGFRIAGRISENDLKLGDRVKPGQVLARLESQNEMNASRTAQANLAAAQGQLTQARNHFERMDTLLRDGWTTRARHDEASAALQTAQSRVDDAEAQLKTAKDLVSFTELKADAPGIVTATDAQLVSAMRFFVERMKLVVEPTGCLAAAAAFEGAVPVKGKRVGVILSGGNVDPAALGRHLAA